MHIYWTASNAEQPPHSSLWTTYNLVIHICSLFSYFISLLLHMSYLLGKILDSNNYVSNTKLFTQKAKFKKKPYQNLYVCGKFYTSISFLLLCISSFLVLSSWL